VGSTPYRTRCNKTWIGVATVTKGGSYHPLSIDQIEQLETQGCTAEDWSRVHGSSDFSPEPFRQVQFAGDLRIGNLNGMVESSAGIAKPAGIYNAYVANCTIGNGVRIANIGSHVANYHIEDGALIEDVGTLETRAGATFGNGIQVETVNEGGGREVTLFNPLSAQFAYMQCMIRWRPKLVERLSELAEKAVAKARSDHGWIGMGARISSVAEIINVAIGPEARIAGAACLNNGTILSCAEAPTVIGAGTVAEDFIIAEGARVDSAAIVCKSFIGQGCQIGKQFSAEGSLFFANCEGFHGEACSVFAGPYSVTHHKSTLLIAGLFSFYNAGSGTNQSNHMYKLGPVHEGKLERGCKTGSFSYMMWPCRVGPFSVVLGKHTRTFDTRDFPFSHVEAKSNGRCEMVPGLYLSTVGTVRDGTKWPTRDRRRAPEKRDIIDFDVLSPLTVGRMLRGKKRLQELSKTTDRGQSIVTIQGAEVRRVLLRKGARFYQAGIEMYLQERLVSRLEAMSGKEETEKKEGSGLAVSSAAVFSEEWIDLAGQMMPRQRFDHLCDSLESKDIDSVEELRSALLQIHEAYGEDEWAWVVWAYQQHYGDSITAMSPADIRSKIASWSELRTKYLHLILGDAEKEFQQATRTGFGLVADGEQADEDFLAVRGTYEDNKFVRQMHDEIAEVARRAKEISDG
jgi:uncharacterized protein DUF4954/uncharacterized protein DUF6819